MPGTPTRDLQVGDLASLEGCGSVTIVAVVDHGDWIEIEWVADPLMPRRPGYGYQGSWSVYYADHPEVWVYHHEDYSHDQETAQPQT